MIISYVTLGTNDREKAESFYDTLLADSPFDKIYSEDRMTMWVNDKFMFALAEPFDGNAATVGNGSMIGFQVDKDTEVDRMYELALSLGGSDEGKPGIRSGHQSAYVRDLDGNKICILA
jgi:catechol 2,3-dioxygenase-like lactoylglutathione lyase family enzyme